MFSLPLFASILAVLGSSLSSNASPLESRASSIQCDAKRMIKGYLTIAGLFQEISPSTYASFNGQRDGSGRQILVTKADNGASDVPREQFQVLVCNSKYMGYQFEQGAYGSEFYPAIIQSVKTPSRCITASALHEDNQRFVAGECSYADDATQEAQMFQYSKTPDFNVYPSETLYTLSLYGKPSGSSDKGGYKLSIGNTANKKVQLDYLSSAQTAQTQTLALYLNQTASA